MAKIDFSEALNSPIGKAVEPLRKQAQEIAVLHEQNRIDTLTAEFEAAGWDQEIVAPYPRYNLGAHAYFQAKIKYELAKSIVVWKDSSHRPGTPLIVSLNVDRVRKYLGIVRQDVSLSFDAYVYKLASKIGETQTAEIDKQGSLWSFSHLTVVTASGETQLWRTQHIINFSKLGLAFNQFPTRRIKIK